jgi:hypothetical protein
VGEGDALTLLSARRPAVFPAAPGSEPRFWNQASIALDFEAMQCPSPLNALKDTQP